MNVTDRKEIQWRDALLNIRQTRNKISITFGNLCWNDYRNFSRNKKRTSSTSLKKRQTPAVQNSFWTIVCRTLQSFGFLCSIVVGENPEVVTASLSVSKVQHCMKVAKTSFEVRHGGSFNMSCFVITFLSPNNIIGWNHVNVQADNVQGRDTGIVFELSSSRFDSEIIAADVGVSGGSSLILS